MFRRPQKHSRRPGVLALAMLIAACVPPALARASNDRISTQRAQIDATRKRLDAKREQLHVQALRAQSLRDALAQTTRDIARATTTLGDLDRAIDSNRRKLAWNQTQLEAARATLRRHDEALRRRLVDVYERGDLAYIDVLLSSTSFSDFVERWDDIRFLIAANQNTIRTRRAAEAEVAAKERQLETAARLLDDDERREAQARSHLAALAVERRGLADAAEAQRRNVSVEVTALEELTANQEAELERYIRERQREEAARRAAEAEARRRAALLAGEAVPPPASDGAPRTFSWPASGPITDPFGMRMHPVTHQWRMHTGLDIGAPMGATIVAAASGRVIYSGWEGGYGNTLIIDHGGNTSTLYGHCSQLFVSEGQEVVRGQAIGAVGSTGVSTGPHLHFEIRINGVAVDPSSRLQ